MQTRSNSRLLAVITACLLLIGVGCKKDKKKEKPKAEEAGGKLAESKAELQKMAEVGKPIFNTKCMSCHTIGRGDTTGPDLKNVTDRRDHAWLMKWMKNTQEMLKNDETAKKLLEEFNNVPMPNQNLKEEEIKQVLAYIKTQSVGDAQEATGDVELKPLANKVKGREIQEFVSSECGGCHNPKRLGATGPDITKKRLVEGSEKKKLKPMNKQTLVATIANGRPGTSMPAWKTETNPIMESLSKAEINAIANYLYTTEAPETFVFNRGDMEETHEVLVEDLPDKPTHDRRVEDLLLVTEREKFRVAVLDGDKLDVVGRMEAGARAHGYTFHPSGRFAYNLGRDGWLYKYDLYTLKPVIRVRLGLDARGIAISDDGKFLLTGMYIPAQAVVVDAETLEPLKIISTKGVKDPNGETVDSRICSVNDVSPKKVGPYFLMALKEGGQVWRIDYSKPDFPVEKVIKVGEILHDGFLSHDNKMFYLASQESDHMAVIDVEKMEIVAKIKTGKKPHPGPGATWSVDGVEYAATPHIGDNKNVIWRRDNFEIAGEVESGAPGLFVRTSPKMKYVWFDSLYDPKPEEITVHEKAPPFKVVKRLTDGSQTVHPEPDADGDYVFVSDWTEDVVRVYDDETVELVKTIEGLETPTGIFSVSRVEETEGH